MINLRFRLAMIFFIVSAPSSFAQNDQYRPKIHFTPETGWTNDPNGMVFYNGTYHLFYQYNPGSTVWGPMHWGHATSKDLFHWKREPIALFPDTIGTIFSGSAVIDKKNSSGFGTAANPPLVAIYTNHSAEAEKRGSTSFQNQSIAYSLDNGKTWTKYSGNPVLRSPGLRDFRDPKVFWHESSSKWIMTLAAYNKVVFYSSPDLKKWDLESEFGKNAGAHGGAWECPDLFPLKDSNGKTVWILIVNINPGGPNNGSATQYFTGDFDGKTFHPSGTETKWLDYGPDEYAGITWSDTGARKIFLGWMSNWLYADKVPTVAWRGAMTVPRDLGLKRIGNELYVSSLPVPELSVLQNETDNKIRRVPIDSEVPAIKNLSLPCRLQIEMDATDDFSIRLGNENGEEILIGFDKAANRYYIDRNKSGKTSFHKDFAGKHEAPRFSTSSKINLDLLIDVSSVELFADDGLTVMTSIFFPEKNYNTMSLNSKIPSSSFNLKYFKLKSSW